MNIKNTITSQIELDKILKTNEAVLLYFKTNSCVVGEAVEPKVYKLIQTKFQKISCFSIDMNQSPKIAANYSAFVEPTLLVFFDGKETIRKSRSFSIFEIEEAIKRPYYLIFE
ncbi:thioredoxin family protein [Lutibacter sp. TH_r2]|uniref:thioredoxin family protein n=1 Tax=Lutibacter sp. TH_r2 TaxID=3082083 RepID=UPI00295497E6|nr:thioredoxin family protein [Lutibacter sp. TH_r2]MDV7185819.1 thioredoxin family protein [Lutibacter sp. TH_r2]